jgi:MFS family permease
VNGESIDDLDDTLKIESTDDLQNDVANEVHNRKNHFIACEPCLLTVAEKEQAIYKLDCRILPIINLLYIVCYIDRSNIGNVHAQLKQDLHLSEIQYALSAGVFFVSYTIFEIPSNMFLVSIGARKWIARIAISWGLVVVFMALSNNFFSFFMFRVLLGATEAGFFPGILLYLNYFYLPDEQSRKIAIFYLAQALSGIVGGLISYITLHSSGTNSTSSSSASSSGLQGWQTLFLVEGIPAVMLGIATYLWLPSNPSDIDFLSPAERQFLESRMQRPNQGVIHDHDHDQMTDALKTEAIHTGRSASTIQPIQLDISPSSVSPSFESHSQGVDQFDDMSSYTPHTSCTPSSVLSDEANSIITHDDDQFPQPLDIQHNRRPQRCSWLRSMTFFIFRPFLGLLPIAVVNAISSYLVVLFAVANFFTMLPISAVTFYLPSIIAGFQIDSITANLISAVPYAIAAVCMYVQLLYILAVVLG